MKKINKSIKTTMSNIRRMVNLIHKYDASTLEIKTTKQKKHPTYR